jgi:hypothetical protein
MSIEHADLPIAAVQSHHESPWRSERAHDYRYDRAGQLADQGTMGIAPPCDPGLPERQRYRSDDQHGGLLKSAVTEQKILNELCAARFPS